MLTPDMKKLITDHSAGMVATINDDGTPSVSPKATFVILSDREIAFGNLRSPGTVSNIRKRPAVEVSFIDVLTRKAVRVSGMASFVRKADAQDDLVKAFEPEFGAYIQHMSGFVRINVTAAETILSPAYDLGITEQELHRVNLKKLNAL